MTNTSGEKNLPSGILQCICHIAKVKPTTSAHYVADVIPFLVQVIFPRIQCFDKAKNCISHTIKNLVVSPALQSQRSAHSKAFLDDLFITVDNIIIT